LILLIIMVSFILTFRTSLGLPMAFWLALVILPTLIFWLAYRR
jgi:hypothetical protein